MISSLSTDQFHFLQLSNLYLSSSTVSVCLSASSHFIGRTPFRRRTLRSTGMRATVWPKARSEDECERFPFVLPMEEVVKPHTLSMRRRHPLKLRPMEEVMKPHTKRTRLTMHMARERSLETEDEAASRRERNQEGVVVHRSLETATDV